MIDILHIRNTDFIEGVNRLLSQLFDASRQITKFDLQEALQNPKFYLLIAQDSSQEYPENIVGMGSIFFQRNVGRWIAEVHDVVVDENYRRRGIATKIMVELMDIVKNFAEQKKREVKVLLATNPWRAEANELYLKLGFTQIAQATESGYHFYKMMIS